MTYKMYAVRVFTTRWDEAVPFYQDTLGWPLRFLDEELGWAQFDLGGSDIGLERVSADDPEVASLVGRFTGISVAVDDIQATYGRLGDAGVRFDGPPERQPWGGTLAHFMDPDGNVLTLLGSSSQTQGTQMPRKRALNGDL